MDKKEVIQKVQTELKIQGKSPRTQRMYTFFNENFLDFIKKSPDSVIQDDIKSFFAYLLSDKKYNASSVALARCALRFCYDEILGKNIVTNIKTPKFQRKIPEIPSKTEIRLMLDHSKNLKNKIMIEFLYSSGLRVSELANLKIKDLNLEEKTGLLKSGKGGKDRFFIMSELLVKDLKEYLKNHKEEYLLIGFDGPISTRSIQKSIQRTAKRANIQKKIYPHLLRHAFATHLLEDGVDIRHIQVLLAHSNLQTTAWYTQVSTKELKKIKSPLDTI
ncbi:MAG: tyrosine-type recombinase/integrase [Candidatus Nanoarchaeia archaeon]|nr:tyrosine-type recombinase/integrase [Candidatus Nanoarchaeia archaeon]